MSDDKKRPNQSFSVTMTLTISLAITDTENLDLISFFEENEIPNKSLEFRKSFYEAVSGKTDISSFNKYLSKSNMKKENLKKMQKDAKKTHNWNGSFSDLIIHLTKRRNNIE